MTLYQGSNQISSSVKVAQFVDATDIMKHMTVEIGDVGQVMLPLNESENRRRYLNGQIILQSQFTRFTNKLRQAANLYPSLVCTEEEWQRLRLTNVDDQCGKFVIDDVNGTIRLPRIKYLVGNLNLYHLADGIPNRRLIKTKRITDADRSWYNIYSDGYCEQGAWFNLSETETFYTYQIPFISMPHLVIGRSRSGRNSVTTNTDFMGTWTPGTTGFRSWGNWNGFNLSYTATGYVNIDKINTQYTGTKDQFESPYYIQVSTGVDYEVDVVNKITTNTPYSFGMIQRSNAKLNNISWLESNGNFHSGNAYPDFYKWLLKNYNTPTDDIIVKLNTASDITEYDYVINITDATFKLPTLLGDENVQSTEYIDISSQFWLVAGTSYTYTAPYNGYFYGRQRATGASQYIGCYNDAIYDNLEIWSGAAGMLCMGPLFMKRGQVMTDIRSNFVGSDKVVRFHKAVSGYKHLYFYVGETIQNANLINAGRIVELSEEIGAMQTRYIVEKWESGNQFRILYNDGWCEQGGEVYVNGEVSVTVTYPKPYADNNYNLTLGWNSTADDRNNDCSNGNNKTPTGFIAYGKTSTGYMSWRAVGYIATK